ncbi:MAG: hypothetical protein EXR72_13985 [Myxococcales bacterium]|nr:hypothetical protein [Myxococcales bacterium]
MRHILLGALLLTACGGAPSRFAPHDLGGGDLGVAYDFSLVDGPIADAPAADLAAAKDQASADLPSPADAPIADAAIAPDLAVPVDAALPADLIAPADAASPIDLPGAEALPSGDLAAAKDQAAPQDLAPATDQAAPDLAKATDLAPPKDQAPPPDLAKPGDLGCPGVCNMAPPANCDTNLIRTYTNPGACVQGMCAYPSMTQACTYGCYLAKCSAKLSYLGGVEAYQSGTATMVALKGGAAPSGNSVTIIAQTFDRGAVKGIHILYSTQPNFANPADVTMIFDKLVNANEQWYGLIPLQPKGTKVVWYVRADGYDGTQLYFSDFGNNFDYMTF